jgi:hypothetical protein
MLYMVFDVESIGLHGEGFAVGWVVVRDSTGERVAEGLFACPPEKAAGSAQGREWIAGNVPAIEVTHDDPFDVRRAFWAEWLKWKTLGAVLAADVPWPVEGRFLNACVDDNPRHFSPNQREMEGPYPLIDIHSFRVLAPMTKESEFGPKRIEGELPEHNPLCDARQSARMLLMAIRDHKAQAK